MFSTIPQCLRNRKFNKCIFFCETKDFITAKTVARASCLHWSIYPLRPLGAMQVDLHGCLHLQGVVIQEGNPELRRCTPFIVSRNNSALWGGVTSLLSTAQYKYNPKKSLNKYILKSYFVKSTTPNMRNKHLIDFSLLGPTTEFEKPSAK